MIAPVQIEDPSLVINDGSDQFGVHRLNSLPYRLVYDGSTTIPADQYEVVR